MFIISVFYTIIMEGTFGTSSQKNIIKLTVSSMQRFIKDCDFKVNIYIRAELSLKYCTNQIQ